MQWWGEYKANELSCAEDRAASFHFLLTKYVIKQHSKPKTEDLLWAQNVCQMKTLSIFFIAIDLRLFIIQASIAFSER